jgi:hypothetical protein
MRLLSLAHADVGEVASARLRAPRYGAAGLKSWRADRADVNRLPAEFRQG